MKKPANGLIAAFTIVCSMQVMAAPVNYQFSGGGDAALRGTFKLDPLAAWNLYAEAGSNSLGTYTAIGGVLSSPLQTISGIYGDYSFRGLASLYSYDQAVSEASKDRGVPDYWIIRARELDGPSFNGLSVTSLNLFIYTGVSATTISLTPPPHGINPWDFQYTVGFSDGSFAGGPLTALSIAAPVPEPETYALWAVGLLGLGFMVKKRRESVGAPVVV